MIQGLFFYHGLMIIIIGASLLLFSRIKDHHPVERSLLLAIFNLSVIFLGAFLYPLDGFGRFQLLAWGLFLYFPLFLLGNVLMVFKQVRIFAYILASVLFCILVIAGDAFLIEPNLLEITRITFYSDKIEEPITVVFLADIQTDSPGPAEARVFTLAAEENPDLVLLSGDYIQLADPGEYAEAIKTLQSILRDANLGPDLGAFAVQGNVDKSGWEQIFEKSAVHPLDSTTTFEFDSLVLTGLSMEDAGNINLSVSGTKKFHIILGHSPNYSLGEIDADLLLAGHTHGGQVQLPGIGPLLTLSAVSREWASGLTEIHPGRYLLVSRGIGLERGNAPRMRLIDQQITSGAGTSSMNIFQYTRRIEDSPN
jgi:predicted MPP superfamily phosphohydrolase